MNIAQVIDHTLLRPEVTSSQIHALCSEARQYGFAAVCVNPIWVALVRELLNGTAVNTCCVVGFPLGASSTETKVHEARWAVAAGAQEIDMVINLGWLKSDQLSWVAQDIAAVRVAAPRPVLLKVIVESAVLSNDELETASILCVEQAADFVKTSTGMHPAGGARIEHVRIIRNAICDRARIKASGGIRSYADLMAFLDAGASRIGCSSSVRIVQDAAKAAPSEPS